MKKVSLIATERGVRFEMSLGAKSLSTRAYIILGVLYSNSPT
jgi:hypothetical protein